MGVAAAKPWRCDHCLKRFKLPPIGHLKRFEGCRLAAQNKGILGYSNVRQKSFADLHHSSIKGFPNLRITVKYKPPSDVAEQGIEQVNEMTEAPALLQTAQAAVPKSMNLKRKARESKADNV